MRVAFFEDSHAAGFHPLSLARPVFELVCGRYSLRERVIRHLPVTEWGVFVREHLADVYHESHPEAHVNDFLWLSRAPTLVINGCWLPSADVLRHDLSQGDIGLSGRRAAFLTLDPQECALVVRNGWEQACAALSQARPNHEARGVFLEYPWDLVRQNQAALVDDFCLAAPQAPFAPPPHVAVVGPAENVQVDPTARIAAFVVLDVTGGPISIGPGAVLEPFTQVSGPCHIDHGARLFSARVRGGTTIGPDCRVGGEIEASILHGWVNKSHDGFLGHSYVCPWVNLGALTTGSDLKNDYTHVRVPMPGRSIDTGMTKVGCFIADHSKTGIGCLLNSGCSIGAMSMILPDGGLCPKHVPSFCKVVRGELTDGMDVEKSLQTARIVLGRRNCELTPAQETLWRRLAVQTRAERENAILRFRERELGSSVGAPA